MNSHRLNTSKKRKTTYNAYENIKNLENKPSPVLLFKNFEKFESCILIPIDHSEGKISR